LLKFEVKSFSELSTKELYAILQLRSEVFVVEQNCVYQDIDGKDDKALHILGTKNNTLIAYTRIFNSGDYFKESSIGRVLVKENQRKFSYGNNLMDFSIKTIEKEYNTSLIKIGAQTYLKKFYKSHGFKKIGEEYIEDGIPHIYMIKG